MIRLWTWSGAANPQRPNQQGRTRRLHWQAGYTRVNLDLCILLQNQDCIDPPECQWLSNVKNVCQPKLVVEAWKREKA